MIANLTGPRSLKNVASLATRMFLPLLLLQLLAGCAHVNGGVAYSGKRVVAVSPVAKAGEVFKTDRYEISLTGLQKELQGYLDRIDTQPWTVSNERFEGQGVLMALPESRYVSVADRAALAKLNKEGYLIRADEKRILLVGNSLLGLQHAMFDFLERLGCRFLTPSEAWTIIPAKAGLHFTKCDVLEEPDFISRRSFFSTGDGAGWAPDGSLKKIQSDCIQWNRKTRQGGYANLAFGHTWGSIIRAHQDEFRKHPEYFRVNKDGARGKVFKDVKTTRPESLYFCPSNPGLMQLCADDRIELLRTLRKNNPREYLVSMDSNDGQQPCYCERCKALGNVTDRYLHLVNHVAREIRKVYPHAAVGALIYAPYNAPPVKEKIEPNVYPQLCTAFNQSDFSYDELVQGWIKAGAKQMLIYDYIGIVQWTHAMPYENRVTYQYVSRAFPYFKKKWKAIAAMLETSSSWGRMGPAVYLMRRLLWDVNADSEAIYSGFFRDAFGAGAQEMRALFDLWEEPSSSQLNDTNITRWLKQMDKALKATENETPAVKRRIDDMLAYLHLVTLYYASRKAVNAKDEKLVRRTMAELLSFNWRIRNRQVVHTWGFMLRTMECLNPFFGGWQWRTSQAAADKKYEKYWAWNIHNTPRGTTVWQKNQADYTSSELHRLFERDLADYSVKTDQNRTFSGNLVPLFKGPAEKPSLIYPKEDSLCGVMRPSVWFLYVDKPTPLRITFNTSRHSTNKSEPGHISRARLTDQAGKVLFQQEQWRYEAGKGQIAEINAELAPGLYRLELDNGNRNSSYRPVFDPPVKHVYEQSVDHSTHIQYFVPGYFYVPKGTKEIRLNYNTFLTLKAPSWKKPRSHDEKTQGLLVIPVGADDGKVWEIRHVTASQFQFLNIPPYVATNKANLLVPKEALSPPGAKVD